METRERDTGMMQTIAAAVDKKVETYDTHKLRYLIRCILAGFYLTLPTVVGIMAWDTVGAGAPHMGKLFYASIFSFGLMMIIFLNAELATSNMMYFFTAAHRKWTSWGKALQIIVVCALMNLAGAIIVGFLIGQSSAAGYFGADSSIMSVIDGKLSKDIWTLLIDGILANVFVNIAIMGQMRLKNEVAKILFILFIIFLFVYAGFEHVIANFSLMSIAFFAGNNMDIGAVLVNWIVVFVANVIGGGVVMGLTYSWLNKDTCCFRD